MSLSSKHVALNGSRLVRFFTDNGVSKVDATQKNFAERLGRLIDLSHSIQLSAAQKQQISEDKPRVEDRASPKSVKQAFLTVRTEIVQMIALDFTGQEEGKSSSSRTKLPRITSDHSFSEATCFDSYKRFYTEYQRAIDFRVQPLWSNIRESVASCSPELKQLANLDMALAESLTAHTRQLFSVVPKLLEKRFETLWQAHEKAHKKQEKKAGHPIENQAEQWLQAGGWMNTFHSDMQELLLAELEVRLQPALGLIEALSEKELSNHE